MDPIIELFMMLGVLISTILLLIKSYIRRDISVFATILPRIYLLGAILYNTTTENLHPNYLHLGVTVIFLGDAISNIFLLMSKKIKVEKYAMSVLDSLRNLEEKYSFLINSVPIGIYTINEYGRFEFVNKEFAEIFESTIDDLTGRSLYDFLPEDLIEDRKKQIKERIEKHDLEVTYDTRIITAKGNSSLIRIHAKTTTNGHKTITGSILKLS